MSDFREALSRRGFLLGDGAMGTTLLQTGISARDLPMLVAHDAEKVLNLHLEYLHHGARVIQTHSFAANRSKLEALGWSAPDVFQLNRKAAQIARHARDIFGDEAWILGSVGPLAAPVDLPLRPQMDASLAQSLYQEAVAGLVAGGVDGFMLETMSDLGTVLAAVKAIRAESVLPLVVSFAFSREGTTLYGVTPEDAMAAMAVLPGGPPFLVGANCGTGPSPLLDAVLRMAPLARQIGVGLVAFPNAGQPELTEGRVGYRATPEYMAHLAPALRDAGCVVIGGCCGVGPQHVERLQLALVQAPPRQVTTVVPPWPDAGGEEAPPVRLASGITVNELLERGRFVVSVELDPPRGVNTQRILASAATMVGAGADLINVGDSPMARVRLSALGTSRLIQEKVGVSTILHFTTRDRNLMGLQSDLLGAYSLGLRNILCLTGDPPGLGDYAHSTAVYDLDSVGLVRVLSGFNQGHDAVGLKLGSPTDFAIGVGMNPNADSLTEERDRLRRKIEAGAMYVMTQPVYDPGQLLRFLDVFGPVPIPILVGVMPLVSYRQAQYLNNEVPGITIPGPVMRRMEGQDSPDKGVELAIEFLDGIRDVVQGMYLVPSFNRIEPLLPVLAHVRSTEGK